VQFFASKAPARQPGARRLRVRLRGVQRQP
jgi:hypothetical protein